MPDQHPASTSDARKRLAENLATPDWGEALADEAEVARTRGRVLGEQRARIAELEAEVGRLRRQLAAVAEVAEERGYDVQEQKDRAEKAEAELVELRLDRAEFADRNEALRSRIDRAEEFEAARIAEAFAAVTPCSCSAQRARAERAEAERDAALAALARVEALADDLDSTVYSIPPGYPMTVNHGLTVWVREPLRAALTPTISKETPDE